MADNVVHFKSAKKRAGYAKKDTQASENRLKFGRTKAEKSVESLEGKRTKSNLDAHKLDT
ncbi:MAG: DUF4169 domain-containing protein [Robiginitomaculum sp.]|nr:MAG: DUF4169 domain-containing protein [Robiginitomaculum sp.]